MKKWSKILLIAMLVVVPLGTYMTFAYPRNVVSFPMSFTVGADVEERAFDVSIFHSLLQVEVIVESGTSLWNAKIQNQDGILWDHTAHQGGQTTYRSGWINVLSGPYNFTFATIGLGSLDAEIKVTSKGGFW